MERDNTEAEAVAAGRHELLIGHDDPNGAYNVHRPRTRVGNQRLLRRIHGFPSRDDAQSLARRERKAGKGIKERSRRTAPNQVLPIKLVAI